MSTCIGILTAGGDCPGLNAAIRGVGKAAEALGMQVIGFRDGFRGMMENRLIRLDGAALSGILTVGGTILGTSRDKPHKMPVGDKTLDMTDAIVANYEKNHLDCLVCLGGGGTHKNALHLMGHGLRIVTLPKTIDNDVAGTDVTFGFDTALGIAAEAIDRLHSTATSHHRIIVVEIMGHRAGWLALGAGIAGGADVILIPELPYDVEAVATAISDRARGGKRFSIVAVAEGAMPKDLAKKVHKAEDEKANATDKADRKKAKQKLADLEAAHANHAVRLADQLKELTGIDARITILGHLQRGGAPSAGDRLLATRLGTACAELIDNDTFGVMVAARGEGTEPVPIDQVAGQRKAVPPDHPWLQTARQVGTCLGTAD